MRAAVRATLAATVLVSIAYLYLGTLPEVPQPLASVPDTGAHFAAYSVLGFLAARSAALLGLAPSVVWGWGYAVAHGAALEVLQSFAPPRRAEVKDLLMDALGAAVGAALSALVRRR